MRQTARSIAVSILCLGGLVMPDQAAGAEVESRLVGREVKSSADGAYDMVLKGSDLDAPTGFANLLAMGGSAQQIAAAANALAARRDMLGKTGQLIVVSQNADAIISQLFAGQKTRRIAAVSLACKAVMTHLATERGIRFGDGRPKRKKGNKKNQAAQAPQAGGGDSDMVKQLLQDRSKDLRQFGLLAAAYMHDPGLQEAVLGCDSKEGPALGAKLRYQALNGIAVTAEQVDAAFDAGRQPRAYKAPDETLSDYNIVVPSRVLACEAVAMLKDAAHLAKVHEAFEDRDIRVRQSAIKAMAEIGDPSSLPLLQKHVEKCNWIELVYVCDALGRHAHKGSIEPLIERLDDEEGRMRLDLMYALNSINGELSFRQTADAWRAWWDTAKDTFEVDQAKTDAFRAAHGLFDNQVPVLGDFYGVNIWSDRFVFVLDTSMSMKGDKIADLRDNTVMTLESLPKHVEYNMVDFGGWITVLYPGGLTGDKKLGIAWAKEMPMSWGTRSYDSIERGAQFGEADTIYFLSDGAPVISHCNKWNGIHAMALFMNRFRPLAIFTVCFQAGGGNAEGMRILAETNYGQTTNIE